MADEHLISLQPGTVIAGRYEVVKCLGQGSMGLVYACRHRELQGHLFALKVLFPEVAQDRVAAQRFMNEVVASYSVSHPNVVRAYEYIRDGDLVAYAMEYVGGGDLADRLGNRDQLLSIPEIVRIISQMCLGVQAIHRAGIVHRDLKPENILITKDGQVKIADFGIARTGHGPKLTEHGGVVGTIDYVSPEYMLNAQVDWRSDIYALGILAYEMTTGESPFRGDSVYATMTKRLKSDPVSPGQLRSECPPELDRIILRAMHREVEQRYQSSYEMYEDLARFMPEKVSRMGVEGLTPGPTHGDPAGLGGGRAGLSDGHIAASAPLSQSRGARSEQISADGVALGGNGAGFSAPGIGVEGRGGPLASTPFDDSQVETSLDRGGRVPRYSWERGGARPISAPSASTRAQPEGRVAADTAINNIAKQFADEDTDATIHEPVRMEPMLGSSIVIADTWDRDGRDSPVVSIPSGGISNDRMRRLSRELDNGSRSMWVDVLILFFAIGIGIGVGFALLKIFFPQVLNRSSTVEVRPVVVETEPLSFVVPNSESKVSARQGWIEGEKGLV